MNDMAVAYLVAGILGIVTAFMICKAQNQLNVAESEFLLLAAANAVMGGVLLCVGGMDCFCLIRNGESILFGCRLPFVYMITAIVEWLFCGLAVLYVKILKQEIRERSDIGL